MLTSNSEKTKHRPYNWSSGHQAPDPAPPTGGEGARGRGGLGSRPTASSRAPRAAKTLHCCLLHLLGSVCLLARGQEGSSFPDHTFLALCLYYGEPSRTLSVRGSSASL